MRRHKSTPSQARAEMDAHWDKLHALRRHNADAVDNFAATLGAHETGHAQLLRGLTDAQLSIVGALAMTAVAELTVRARERTESN